MLVEPIVDLVPTRTAKPSHRLRILVIATLFPNPVQPVHGVFVLRRMRHVADICDVHILAPVAWFPWATTVFQRYRQRIGIPKSATLDGLHVEYPRFLSIPRYWKPLDPLFLFLAACFVVPIGAMLSRGVIDTDIARILPGVTA